MVFLYLFTAHLIGDFVLQPGKLIIWKQKSDFGIFIHSFIQFLAVLMFYPAFLKGDLSSLIIAGLFIFSSHYFIDRIKIRREKISKKRVMPYLIDQFVHLIMILIASIYLNALNFTLNEVFILPLIVICSVILSTQWFEIFLYQFKREKNKKAVLSYNSTKILRRLIVLFLILLSFIAGTGLFNGGQL